MSELTNIVRGPLLVPRENGQVDFFADGALGADAGGTLRFVGPYAQLESELLGSGSSIGHTNGWDHFVKSKGLLEIRPAHGVMLPPLVDIHIHIPQHPIRGHFVDGVPDDAPQGKLLAGLQKNVFPTEAKCHDAAIATSVVDEFRRDTLSHGAVGGCAYMMVSPRATDIALATLGDLWNVGMVLMNQKLARLSDDE